MAPELRRAVVADEQVRGSDRVGRGFTPVELVIPQAYLGPSAPLIRGQGDRHRDVAGVRVWFPVLVRITDAIDALRLLIELEVNTPLTAEACELLKWGRHYTSSSSSSRPRRALITSWSNESTILLP